MSTENQKSSPAPTRHEDENRRNQSTRVERSKSNFKTIGFIIVAAIVIIIILAFSGLLQF